MTAQLARPAPETTATRALEIHAAIEADPERARLWDTCAKYNKDWTDFTGYPIISDYDALADAPALFEQTLRAMAIKSAVYDLTGGDEALSEVAFPVPLDVMSHALIAQFTLLCRMQARGGFHFVHMTDMENGVGGGEWDHGDYGHQVYELVWGSIDPRFWIGAEETERRRRVLDGIYAGIGVTERGKKVAISFAEAA